MCAESNFSTTQEPFCKILKQLAGQLWLSKLQETLYDPVVLKHLTEKECSRITTYEQLFDHFIAKELVTPSNITILKAVLRNHDLSCALLRAVYEAGFGREGLVAEDKCTTVTNIRKPTSLGQPKAVKDFKTLLKRIDNQFDSKEDLGALKLLCCSVLSFRQLDGFTSALDVCNALRRAKFISPQKPEFLYRLLQDCGRWDLCDLVDGYVYTCETIPPSYPCPEPRDRKNSDRRRKISYQFVQALKNLGDQLDSDDLAMMKLLAGTCIPDSKLEKAENIYEFLILLQDRGKLGQKNISFLEQLLDDKLHVVNPLYDMGFGCKTQPHKCKYEATAIMKFKQLLKTIGSRLTSENISELKFLCSDEGTGSLSNIHSGIELLSQLEKRTTIGPNNVHFLMELLQEVGRSDLGSIVSTYISQQPPQGVQSEVVRIAREAKTLAQYTPTHRGSTDTLQLLESMTMSKASQSCENSLTLTGNLFTTPSREKLFQEPELREEYGEFRRKVEAELTRKDKQIEELTRKLNDQQTLLNRLALRLGLRDDDDI